MDWQTMDTAPRDGTAIQAKIPGNGEDNVIAWMDNFMDADGLECSAWAFVEDQEPPPCWTDGVCWKSNEYGDESEQPTAWKRLTT